MHYLFYRWNYDGKHDLLCFGLYSICNDGILQFLVWVAFPTEMVARFSYRYHWKIRCNAQNLLSSSMATTQKQGKITFFDSERVTCALRFKQPHLLCAVRCHLHIAVQANKLAFDHCERTDCFHIYVIGLVWHQKYTNQWRSEKKQTNKQSQWSLVQSPTTERIQYILSWMGIINCNLHPADL